MGILRALRRNRLLVFAVVASLALLLSVAFVFDFHLAGIVAFLWQCVLMIVAMIVCAAVLFALLLVLRALLGRGAD